MNRKEQFVLLKNAAANVARGSTAAMTAIILPPFLVRLMSADSYGTWSLVLQLSAYVGYLDFGIQTAVGRFVAHANEKRDLERRDAVVSTSFAALAAVGFFGIAGSVGVAVLLPHLFRQMPTALVGDARVALVVITTSLALGLPASVFNGVFVGLQRSEVPASIIAGSRIVSAVGVVLVARHGGRLVPMAILFAAGNLASYLLQYWVYRSLARGTKISRKLVTLTAARELYNYCLSLTIWSFATLLVMGLDITLVAFFDFPSVAYYTVSATLITFILGLQNAIFGAMIPAAAVLDARGNTTELGSILISTTRYGMFLLFASGVAATCCHAVYSIALGRCRLRESRQCNPSDFGGRQYHSTVGNSLRHVADRHRATASGHRQPLNRGFLEPSCKCDRRRRPRSCWRGDRNFGRVRHWHLLQLLLQHASLRQDCRGSAQLFQGWILASADLRVPISIHLCAARVVSESNDDFNYSFHVSRDNRNSDRDLAVRLFCKRKIMGSFLARARSRRSRKNVTY